MPKDRDLARGDIFPASWTDAIQEFIASMSGNLRLRVTGDAQITAVAGSGVDQVGVGVNGLWRYRTSSTAVTVSPGGSPVTQDIFVTASANVFSESPSPDTDNTDYSFGLEVKTQGQTPSTYAYRKVGEYDWDGSRITHLRQLVGAGDTSLPVMPTALSAGVTPLKVRAASSQSAPLAVFENSSGTALATIAADGSASFAQAVTVAAGGVKLTTGSLEFGGDAAARIARAGAGRVQASGALEAVGNVIAGYGGTQATLGDAGSSKPGLILNDAKVYRNGIGVVRVENVLDAVSGFSVNGVPLSSSHLADTAALARLASPIFSGTVSLPSVASTATTLGFFGQTPQTRKDYTLANYTQVAGHRSVDRSNLTMDQLTDLVFSIASDLLAFGLFT